MAFHNPVTLVDLDVVLSECWGMIGFVSLRLTYVVLCRITSWLVLLTRTSATKDVEILALRHTQYGAQANPKPRLHWADHAMLAALIRLLPRALNV